MSHFSWVMLEPLPQRGLWRTHDEIIWDCIERDYWLLIPPMYSDLATVPKWVWPVLEAGPTQLALPGFVHDYLVRQGAKVIRHSTGESRPVASVEEATGIMDNVMEWSGVSRRDRWMIASALNTNVVSTGYWLHKPLEWAGEVLDAISE